MKATKIFFTFLGIIGLVFSLESNADLITNGYICDVKNPGGDATRAGYREQDGAAKNILKDFQFTLSCPVPIPYGEAFYYITVIVGNTNRFTQTFKCVLEEYTPFKSKIRSLSRSVSVPSQQGKVIAFEEYVLSDKLNYLTMWCSLPPLGEIGVIAFE